MARLNAKWNNFWERGQTWYHFWTDTATTSATTTTTTSTTTTPSSGGLKTINSISKISIKTWNGLAFTLMKTFNGLALTSSTLNNGLVGYWKFDAGSGSSAVDSSGNNYTLTLSDSSKWSAGHIGAYCALFSGANSISGTRGAAIPTSGQEYTIAFWVLDDTDAATLLAGYYHRFIAYYDGTAMIQVGLANIDGSTRAFYIGDNGLDVSAKTATSAISTGWHHVVAMCYGNGYYEMYLDGSINMGGSIGGTATPYTGDSTNLYIGQRGNATGYVIGNMDDVRIYNRILTSSEIVELYNYV